MSSRKALRGLREDLKKKNSCVGDYPAKKPKVLTCRLRQQPCELSALLHEMLCKDLLNNNHSVLLVRAY